MVIPWLKPSACTDTCWAFKNFTYNLSKSSLLKSNTPEAALFAALQELLTAGDAASQVQAILLTDSAATYTC